MPAPRIFCIPATDAPVVAVLRRGPTDWCHVGRWELDPVRYVPGAWLRGTLYPQRCDLSPDGRWLSYFALGARADWSAGGTYIAISRLPWLTALAAWGTGGTWTRGAHFVDDPGVWSVGAPDEGDVQALRRRFGLALAAASAYAVERRRGWTETADSPPRDSADAWDEGRGDALIMRKPRPGGGATLFVNGAYAASREGPPGAVRYRLEGEDGSGVLPLPDVQWADWSAAGQLLVATTDGRLQVRESAAGWATTSWEYDEAALLPDPARSPPEAHEW